MSTISIGERIRFFRKFRGMKQKDLGLSIGFEEKAADNRIAQYETNYRAPKKNRLDKIAEVLQVSPTALAPDINSYAGIMHTLFILESAYGLKISEVNGEVCLKVDASKNEDAARLHEMLCSWRQIAAMLESVDTPHA